MIKEYLKKKQIIENIKNNKNLEENIRALAIYIIIEEEHIIFKDKKGNCYFYTYDDNEYIRLWNFKEYLNALTVPELLVNDKLANEVKSYLLEIDVETLSQEDILAEIKEYDQTTKTDLTLYYERD